RMAKRITGRGQLVGYPLIWPNVQLNFEFLQMAEQRRQPFLFAGVIKGAQLSVRFAFAAGALRELVGGESASVTVGARQRRRFREKFRGGLVVVVVVVVKPGQGVVKFVAV